VYRKKTNNKGSERMDDYAKTKCWSVELSFLFDRRVSIDPVAMLRTGGRGGFRQFGRLVCQERPNV
jgi:hypothetical protein